MNTALVWVLVTFVNGYSISYSPPVSTLQECQAIAQAIKEQRQYADKTCVKIKMVTGVK